MPLMVMLAEVDPALKVMLPSPRLWSVPPPVALPLML